MIRIILYNVVFMAVFPFFLLWFLFQKLYHKKFQRGFGERFARISIRKSPGKHSVLWVHAASVGEVLASEPILSMFNARHPHFSLLLTTNTDTGYAVACKKLPFLDNLFQAPFDLHPIIKRFIRIAKPAAIVIMETELWPNLIVSAARSGIPIMIANGRISDRSLPRYTRLSWFLGPILKKVTLFAMQSSRDADRIIRIGAASTSVATAGNVKFDRELPTIDQTVLREVLDRIGWPDPGCVIIAGSTHEEEEPVLLEAFLKIRTVRPDTRLLMAPRHLNRIPDVIACIQRYRLPFVLRSDPGKVCRGDAVSSGIAEVLILDVMGELATAYACGFVSFVGGSLQRIGGHNVLEPAALAKPVLVGPYTMNFRDPVEQLLADNAAVCVRDADEIAEVILHLLQHPDEAVAMGQKGLEMVRRNRGSVLRHVKHLENMLGAGGQLESPDLGAVHIEEPGNG